MVAVPGAPGAAAGKRGCALGVGEGSRRVLPDRPPGRQRRRRTRPAGPAPRRPYHATGERGRERVDARVELGTARARGFCERFEKETAHAAECLGLLVFFFFSSLRKYKRNVSILCSTPQVQGEVREPNGPWRRFPNYISQALPWAGRGAVSGWCRRWGGVGAGDGGVGGNAAVALLLCASPTAAPGRGAPVRKRGCRPGAARTAPCQGAVASRPSKPPPGSVSLLTLHGDGCLCFCVCPSVSQARRRCCVCSSGTL